MRAPRTVWRLALISALTATAVSSTLQAATSLVSPFLRLLAELSNADRQALERAQREVLETMQPGAVSAWKDGRTGHYGEARLLRNYEWNGMACGEVEHMLKIRQVSRYVMPLCRLNDGTWRLAY
jgi:surface antigen